MISLEGQMDLWYLLQDGETDLVWAETDAELAERLKERLSPLHPAIGDLLPDAYFQSAVRQMIFTGAWRCCDDHEWRVKQHTDLGRDLRGVAGGIY